jgi:NAD(P)-dependent dehydrogenase (short-subunit alcohol dehydrogenase family)
MRGLAGKTAVVAGGAGGLGTASCLRLAEEGAAVVVGDLKPAAAQEVAERIRSGGGRAIATGLDIADPGQVEALFELATREYGGFDIVHANAADTSKRIVGRDADVVNTPLEVFDQTISVDLRGYVLCSRSAIPVMLERGGGAMVFTSSTASLTGMVAQSSYAMAKSGVNSLVRHIAARWGKQGIRANAVAPGLVVTGSTHTLLSEKVHQQALDEVASTRLGRPEDIGAIVSFLVSDDAEWINGQVIVVDGGRNIR